MIGIPYSLQTTRMNQFLPLPKIPAPKFKIKDYKLISADPADEDNEKLLDSTPETVSRRDRCFRFVSWMVFVLGLIMILLPARRAPNDKECAAQVSVWSPLNEAIEYESKDQTNYFSHESEFRGPPTPELERKWTSITDFPSISIPHSKIALLNRSAESEDFVQASVPGRSGFIAGIEVFHQLHCLNYVRQFTWLDYYENPPDDLTHGEVANRMHVDHCIETLRLALMCNADVTPYLIRSKPGTRAKAESDFSAFHKCKRFDLLTDWMERNAFKQPLDIPPHEH